MYMSCDEFSQSHMECLYLVLVLVCSFIVLFVMQIDLVRSPLYSMLSDYKSRPNFCSFFNQYHLVVSIDSWSSADPMP